MHANALIDRAAELQQRVFAFAQPAERVIASFFEAQRALGPRERRVVADTLYELLRRRLRYEWLAAQQPLEGVALARRLVLLAWQGDVGRLHAALPAPQAAWLERCAGVACIDAPPPTRHNLPPWIASRLQQQLGPEYDAAAQALAAQGPLDLRVNLLKARRDEVRQQLAALGIESTPTPFSPWGLRVVGKPSLAGLQPFRDGLVEVQDEGSQLLALLVGAVRGEMVADWCAGAGGKTLALAAAMRNSGRLYAFDTGGARLDKLGARAARAGVGIVHTMQLGESADGGGGRDERIERLAGKLDRVLVDAPCSGLGTLRRQPDLKWRQTEQMLPEMARRQHEILGNAARLLRRGGRLVYATCSLLVEENEEVAAAFSAAQPGFRLQPAGELLRGKAGEGLLGPDAQFLRLWPHRHGCDGFFAAVWERE